MAVATFTDDMPEPDDVVGVTAYPATIGWPTAGEFRPHSGMATFVLHLPPSAR